LELVGQWFGAWRGWDGVRALDYLLSRPEVDRQRVGITGNSGGGTMTTWLWAYETRFTMAAPSCFVTTFLANLENELPADCEQYPPGVIGAGMEMADFLIARAPEPLLLLGQSYDYFDRRGLREAHDEIRRFYDLLGAPAEAHELFIGPRPHGFGVENQEAMVEFFVRHSGLDRMVRIRTPRHLDEEQGKVTPQANTVAAGATPIYEQIHRIGQQQVTAREEPGPEQLAQLLPRLLHLPKRGATPHYRVLRPQRLEGYTVARYAVETERSIRALLHKRLADPATAGVLEPEPKVTLWVPHTGSAEDLAADGMAQQLMAATALYAVDVRGLGESMQDEEGGNLFHAYGIDYTMHGYGLLFGESYLGRRIHDVLSVIDLLEAGGTRDVTLYGRGQGAVIALFAALLHQRVTQVTLKNAPLAYMDWVSTPLVAWPAANIVQGALAAFDLPDALRALGSRVRLVQPWGPDMKPLTPARARRQLKGHSLPASLLQRG
jgi:cephalosporin-C deacetylase-like acetyl esterase